MAAQAALSSNVTEAAIMSPCILLRWWARRAYRMSGIIDQLLQSEKDGIAIHPSDIEKKRKEKNENHHV
jgi:hypothetical protein